MILVPSPAFANHARHPDDRRIALSDDLSDIALLHDHGNESNVKALLIDIRAIIATCDLTTLNVAEDLMFIPMMPPPSMYAAVDFINLLEEKSQMVAMTAHLHVGHKEDDEMPGYNGFHEDVGDDSVVQTCTNLGGDDGGTWFACGDKTLQRMGMEEACAIYTKCEDIPREEQLEILKATGVKLHQVPFGHMLAFRCRDGLMPMLHSGALAAERKMIQIRLQKF